MKKNSFPLALLFVNIPIILLSRREAMSRYHDYLKAAAISGNAAARHPPLVVGVFHFVVFNLATVE